MILGKKVKTINVIPKVREVQEEKRQPTTPAKKPIKLPA